MLRRHRQAAPGLHSRVRCELLQSAPAAVTTCGWTLLTLTRVAQVIKGADVVLIIERSKTDKNDKPFEDIKILNFTFQSGTE